MKHSLTLKQVLRNIEQGIVFEADLADDSAYIKIEEYVPFVAFAIHNGHNFSDSLAKKCLLSEDDRLYEEDPHTLDLVAALPIVIGAKDSRYAYDLNRKPKEAIYTMAWGKPVWRELQTPEEKAENLRRHDNFYRLVHAIIQKLEQLFVGVLVFDVHSFNYKRINYPTPVFNVGTKRLKHEAYNKYVAYWIKELNKIKLPNIDVLAEENAAFFGRGYLLNYITYHFDNTLVLATEIKKIYCDESTSQIYPLVMEQLTLQFKRAAINTAGHFIRRQTKLTKRKNNTFLSSNLDKVLLKVDKQLYEIARNFEILNFVNPTNSEGAKRIFFKSRYQKNPEFTYRPMVIDPFEFKRKLYTIPVEKIKDVSQRILYQDVIDSYADKIDIIASIGTDKFMYNSLRYFGEPNSTDISNAEYLLHCSAQIDGQEEANLRDRDVQQYFIKTAADYGFQCKVEISRKTISQVLILNRKKTVRIREGSAFSEKSLHALLEHEIGVHMLSTINSRLQPILIFRLGTPLNTHTQEGLAVLSEYLSGNLSIKRLQTLALRVLSIQMFLKGYDFKRTFHYLMDTADIDQDQAFYMTARIFRGGGFTKDYLYLKGFRDVLRAYKNDEDLIPLLIGKTSLKYRSTIKEMIERKILLPPQYKTRSFLKPVTPDPIIDYILEGLT